MEDKQNQRDIYRPGKGRWACSVRGCLYSTGSYHSLIWHEENEHGEGQKEET